VQKLSVEIASAGANVAFVPAAPCHACIQGFKLINKSVTHHIFKITSHNQSYPGKKHPSQAADLVRNR